MKDVGLLVLIVGCLLGGIGLIFSLSMMAAILSIFMPFGLAAAIMAVIGVCIVATLIKKALAEEES